MFLLFISNYDIVLHFAILPHQSYYLFHSFLLTPTLPSCYFQAILFDLYYYFSSYIAFDLSSEIVLFLFLYTLLLFLSISTFTSLFFKLFKFLNTPLKLFLFLPCFLTYFFNLYHHNQLAFSSNQPRTVFWLLLTSLENFKWFPLVSLYSSH